MAEELTLPEELADEIRSRVFGDGFIRLTQSLTRDGAPFRISLRPVRLKGEVFIQAEMCDNGRTQVRNLSDNAARKGLEDILRQSGKRDLHVISTAGDLHIRVTKKGKPLVSRGKPKASANADAPVIPDGHDH
ncbi:MAG: hypothetical protein J6V91_00635, partial [Kiritimatiellae bacterium]|nr:hypothetical protein [Kiritimatiellia bacterium]